MTDQNLTNYNLLQDENHNANKNIQEYNKIGKSDDIIDDIEKGLVGAKLIPEVTPSLVFVKSLRSAINKHATELETSAKRLNHFDWLLFGISILCMGLTGLGIDHQISDHLTLVQLFGSIAVIAKTTEKTLNLSKASHDKLVASANMKIQLRQIFNMEMNYYMAKEGDKDILMNDILIKAQSIWEKYDALTIEGFIHPDSSDDGNLHKLHINTSKSNTDKIHLNIQDNNNDSGSSDGNDNSSNNQHILNNSNNQNNSK